jgi:hypothetical protein
VLAMRVTVLNCPLKDPPLACARRDAIPSRTPTKLARVRKVEGLIGFIS